ncbi:hypothetical protein B0H14DRAFT_3652021 [Mycena olivaceomarginata]|nr:hypothetical protein B0H14DRAFT_3652021 [Mycena olivaceomarginata]
MLSLGPGSACDVCLEPFGAELKAPCFIPCGHVFCERWACDIFAHHFTHLYYSSFVLSSCCLRHVARARPTCPLCRTPFDTRHTIKLHIDLDNIPAAVDPLPVSPDSDEGARQLQSRITQLAAVGATEAQATQLTEECKRFLQTVSEEMYSDLRTSYKMLSYMCHVKRNLVEQGRTVDLLQRNVTTMTQEVDRLKAANEALEIGKRNLDQVLQTTSTERDDLSLDYERLAEKLDNAEAQVLLFTE